jgi:uncharacterized Fe-S cluster protein YjdI
MPKDTLHYTNDDITVVWKPKACIHSTLCWKGLIDVFNPRVKPWVKMSGASTAKIIDQVRKCPSGALSYYLNSIGTKDDMILSEAASILKIQVTPNGPLLVNSECLIIHSNGQEETRKGSVALCRCGSSQNKPYCDGSHGKINFQG